MSFSLGGLTAYTEQNKMELITKAVFGAKTISLLTPQAGIKSSAKINLLDSDAVFQAGGSCAFNASGTTTLTQREIVVGAIKVEEELCPKSLEAYYTQTMLKPGSVYESIPFEQQYTELKAKLIAKQMETAIWKGDLSSADAALNKFDGIIKVGGKSFSSTGIVNVNAIAGTGTVATTSGNATLTGTSSAFTSIGIAAGDKIKVGANTYTVSAVGSATSITLTGNAAATVSGSSYTWIPQYKNDGVTANPNFASPITAWASNYIANFQAIYNAFPVEILDKSDLTVFCGMDVFRGLQNAITDGKYFNYTGESANFELMFPGTNMKIVAVNGLNETNQVWAFPLSNSYFGTDLLGEEDSFEMWYSKDDRVVKYSANWKAGFQFAFLNQVVQFTLA